DVMKILLIEDDPETAEHVCHALRAQGHDVDESRTGPDGLARARADQHAVLIVDRMLPGLDGLSLVRQFREEGGQTPVLFLTTMSGMADGAGGLKGGGDDYLAKPFALAELVARVNAIARRRETQPPVTFKAGDLEMDLLRRTVQRGGRAIDLQPQEFRLLEYL